LEEQTMARPEITGRDPHRGAQSAPESHSAHGPPDDDSDAVGRSKRATRSGRRRPAARSGKPDARSSDKLDADSIAGFCRRHSISRSQYYVLRDAGLGPDETRLLGRVLITKESAARWRRKHTRSPAADDPDTPDAA
jgi:hypothetical protein